MTRHRPRDRPTLLRSAFLLEVTPLNVDVARAAYLEGGHEQPGFAYRTLDTPPDVPTPGCGRSTSAPWPTRPAAPAARQAPRDGTPGRDVAGPRQQGLPSALHRALWRGRAGAAASRRRGSSQPLPAPESAGDSPSTRAPSSTWPTRRSRPTGSRTPTSRCMPRSAPTSAASWSRATPCSSAPTRTCSNVGRWRWIHHEVGTHLVTQVNGMAQPVKVLGTGLAGYDETQEGLAVLAEIACGGLTSFRLRQLAGRVLTVHRRVGSHLPGRAPGPRRRRLSPAQRVHHDDAGLSRRRADQGRDLPAGAGRPADPPARGGGLDLLFRGKFSLRDLPSCVTSRSAACLARHGSGPGTWTTPRPPSGSTEPHTAPSSTRSWKRTLMKIGFVVNDVATETDLHDQSGSPWRPGVRARSLVHGVGDFSYKPDGSRDDRLHGQRQALSVPGAPSGRHPEAGRRASGSTSREFDVIMLRNDPADDAESAAPDPTMRASPSGNSSPRWECSSSTTPPRSPMRCPRPTSSTSRGRAPQDPHLARDVELITDFVDDLGGKRPSSSRSRAPAAAASSSSTPPSHPTSTRSSRPSPATVTSSPRSTSRGDRATCDCSS